MRVQLTSQRRRIRSAENKSEIKWNLKELLYEKNIGMQYLGISAVCSPGNVD
jgi:hypothetical protein